MCIRDRVKKIESSLVKQKLDVYDSEKSIASKAAEEETAYLSKPEIEKRVREKRKAMEAAAKELDFMQAAKLRDEIKMLQEKLKEMA
jgi:excinuclease ABC subunit B